MSPSARRLPLQFDAARLQADLAQVAQADWQGHFNRRIYDGDWSVMPLRATPDSPIPIFSVAGEQDQEDTPLLQACADFKEVLAAFRCPLLSVRLLRLGPGAVINEHSDPDLSLEHKEVRIHVVVATNPGVECRIDGTPYHWAAGECWYADFTKPHAFANRGETERVHIVLDCTVNDWLRQLIQG